MRMAIPSIVATRAMPTVPPSRVPRWTISAESVPDIQAVAPTIAATYSPISAYHTRENQKALLPPFDSAPPI